MKILTGFHTKISFQKSGLKESNKYLNNPGCGWYHIHTFKIPLLQGEEAGREEISGSPSAQELLLEELPLYDGSDEEQLALVLIDISAYRVREFSGAALSYVKKIFDLFRSAGKQMILRFAYDTEGKGMEREPSSIGLVKRHMEQVGRIVQEYAADILVMQGVFVGSWGEMHSSKFLSSRELPELANTLYLVTAGSCFLAVRTPVQWRRIVKYEKAAPAIKSRLALFNDGIFGSETDMGTYGKERREAVGETGAWSRREELDWQEYYMASAPNGGEALWGKEPVGWKQAVADMRKMHLSYLNCVYHPEVLAYWKKERIKEAGVWKGVSGFDYIGCHLGYRFTVRDVKLSKRQQLTVTVENSGFAGLYEEAECFLMLRNEDGEEIYVRLREDVRNWKSGECVLIRTVLPGWKEKSGSCSLFLQIKRKRDGKIIYFANEGAGEKLLLGKILQMA